MSANKICLLCFVCSLNEMSEENGRCEVEALSLTVRTIRNKMYIVRLTVKS